MLNISINNINISINNINLSTFDFSRKNFTSLAVEVALILLNINEQLINIMKLYKLIRCDLIFFT